LVIQAVEGADFLIDSNRRNCNEVVTKKTFSRRSDRTEGLNGFESLARLVGLGVVRLRNGRTLCSCCEESERMEPEPGRDETPSQLTKAAVRSKGPLITANCEGWRAPRKMRIQCKCCSGGFISFQEERLDEQNNTISS
jgi:hypothetical protein